jgi:OmcA/MtrC family decaheme c-type cytochrome
MPSNIGLWARFAALIIIGFFIAACDGSDGAPGAQGPQGPQGPQGLPGDPAPAPDALQAAIDEAKPEACATCHGEIGEKEHQSVYDTYVDPSRLALTIDNVTSAPDGLGTFTVTVDFSITWDNQPYVDTTGLTSLDQKRFTAVQYDSATRQYLNDERLDDTDAGQVLNVAPGAVDGAYVLTQTGIAYAPEAPAAPFDGAYVYGYIAQTPLFEHDSPTSELPEGTHVHLYDNVSNAGMAFGTAAEADPNSYESAANVSGCVNCHGSPYLKHGYRSPEVAGFPDFTSCKSCHYDDRNGGHEDWQYMVDDPLNWATAGLPTATVEAKYAYKAKLMNDVHMAHAMEFPYPRSMANCSTCHAGKLDVVLDNSNFRGEVCRSCHPVEGNGAWHDLPDIIDPVTGDEIPDPQGIYAQEERAIPLLQLWTEHQVDSFHNINDDCQTCHGVLAEAPTFNELHTGYDVRIADETGTKYRSLFVASIDDVSVDLANSLMTISYSADASGIANAVPGTLDVYVLISFYGWDTKHFIVPSHNRDPDRNRYEFNGTAADPPLFPSVTELAPGSWELTVDLAAWSGQPDSIPNLIADGAIRKAEVTLAPRLQVLDHEDDQIPANLNAVTQTFDIGAGAFVNDYFKGDNATVDVANCEKCHDQLAVTWHTGRGRGGDIVACKNCHNPTFAGSHVEMASRSVENYVHAIHSFQDFDIDDSFHDDAPPDDPAHGEDYDPVLAKRYDQHIQHVFPNFTIRNCEACHNDETFDVPDQTKSMPGLLSASQHVDNWYEMVDTDTVVACDPCIPDTIAVLKDERNIGTVPEYVVGPASRACGGCHRARLINRDLAGELAAFNAHTQAGGTLVENDDDDDPTVVGTDTHDEVLFGIIEEIMSMFE